MWAVVRRAWISTDHESTDFLGWVLLTGVGIVGAVSVWTILVGVASWL